MRSPRAAIASGLLQCLAAAALAYTVRDVGSWDAALLVFLLVFAVVGDRLEVETRTLTISGAFLAIALAMVMLGPVPAAAIGLATTAADAIERRPRAVYVVTNVATFLAFPLVGGGLVHAVSTHWGIAQGDVNFAVIVIGSFLCANALNFVQVATARRLVEGASFWSAFRKIHLPLMPSHLAVAT